MADRRDQRMGTDHHAVSDADLADIEDRKVMVTCEIAADKDVLSAVAVEGFGNPNPLTDRPEHLLELSVLGLIICSIDCVEDFAVPDGSRFPGYHPGVIEAVGQTRIAFFQFCHGDGFLPAAQRLP